MPMATPSRAGLSDWLLQRASALLLAAYTLCILGFILQNPGLGHAAWQGFFAHPAMKAFSALALLAAIVHAWVGMWTLGTDYLQALALRLLYQCLCILALLAYLAWGLLILWGSAP